MQLRVYSPLSVLFWPNVLPQRWCVRSAAAFNMVCGERPDIKTKGDLHEKHFL